MSELVKEFYSKNAAHFSRTRNEPWPGTKKFLDVLPSGSKILDIGCGNGRNMFYRNDLDIIGLEQSEELCKIVEERGGKVKCGNMVDLPFESEIFDYVMGIASYHHLDNDKDRERALKEFYRVLKPGGRLYLLVWAKEQPEKSKRIFTKKDEIVEWQNTDGKVFYRYYHIYSKGDLVKEVNLLEPRFKHLQTGYEEGNWICYFIKNTF
jgi:tRNA (uracil-5-)-methyltransferase TRM9